MNLHVRLAVAVVAGSLLLACGSFAPDAGEPDLPPFPDIPAIDFTAWTPGTDPDLDKIFDRFGRSTGPKGAYDIRGEKNLETNESAGAALKHYRDHLVDPSWDIQGEDRESEVAWLIWKAHDSEDNLWFGSLVATPSGEGRVRVWLSLYSDDLR